MNITNINKNYVLAGAAEWRVDRDYFDPIFNYLVHGYEPGSFFTALLANDFMGAIARSHPGNRVENLKALCGWIQDRTPRESFGSYEKVDAWIKLPEAARRSILERRRFLLSEKEEVTLILKGKDFQEEPSLY